MSEVAERVARAICRAELPTEDKWRLCIPAARAAIEAMREPTLAMQNSGWREQPQSDDDTTDYFTPAWQAAIDAAMEGEK